MIQEEKEKLTINKFEKNKNKPNYVNKSKQQKKAK